MNIGCHSLPIKTLKKSKNNSKSRGHSPSYSSKGKTLIDGSSGLYCNPLGHGRKEIINAIKKSTRKLDYTMPFQQGLWWLI